ncbi:MAG: hypothetical protein PUC01_09405 [Spirochaetales bacterium]|nr:hypothetical protein [Spirochaetales bacterium]
MKKLISVLALLVLVTCVVFAETITLNSTVNAGSGVTESGTGSVISGGDQQGFWLKVSYNTDNDSTVRSLENASETAILTADDSLRGVRSLNLYVTYAGNPTAAGSVDNVRISTNGWQGEANTATAGQSVAISFDFSTTTEANDPLRATINDSSTSSNVLFNVAYPSGLTATAQRVATIATTWPKSNTLPAGNYSATINVEVSAN